MAPILALVALTFNGCKNVSDRENEHLIERYIKESNVMGNIRESRIALVIPSHSCGFCKKKLTQWQENTMDTAQGDFIVISDIRLPENFDNVFIDTVSHRLSRYNPYFNKAFFFYLKEGKVLKSTPIELSNLDSVDIIYKEFWSLHKQKDR